MKVAMRCYVLLLICTLGTAVALGSDPSPQKVSTARGVAEFNVGGVWHTNRMELTNDTTGIAVKGFGADDKSILLFMDVERANSVDTPEGFLNELVEQFEGADKFVKKPLKTKTIDGCRCIMRELSCSSKGGIALEILVAVYSDDHRYYAVQGSWHAVNRKVRYSQVSSAIDSFRRSVGSRAQ